VTVTVGDINLNGIAYEIGDAIVFVQYLMGAPLTNPELQTSNSDINGDGVFWSVGDLVMLLNIINDNGGKASAPGGDALVKLSGTEVSLTSTEEVGAAYFTLRYEGEISEPELSVEGMDLEWTSENGLLTVLVYSLESNRIPAGTHTLFTVPGVEKLVVQKVEVANAGGAQLGIRVVEPPKSFALYQNKPNPVRTTAEIAYALPTDSKVTLRVYDAAGMLVETLVNNWKEAGVYTASWDARGIANGVYFYKLEAGKMSATRKLILMR
jgi:hypothetical protein